jgi:hypothetical protein
MDQDEDREEMEDLEELDLEPSLDEHVRYLRVAHPDSGGFPGGFPGSNSGGSSSGQQLRVPRKPNMRSMPRNELQKDGTKPRKAAGITTSSIFTRGAIACGVLVLLLFRLKE